MKTATDSHNYSQLFSLTPKQSEAIELLLSGMTDAEVAANVNVARETVCRWRLHHPEFIAEFNRRKAGLIDSYQQGVRNLIGKAIKAAEEALDSDDHELKVRTAFAILKMLNISSLNLYYRGPESAEGIIREKAKLKSSEETLARLVTSEYEVDLTLKSLVDKLEGLND
jgi:hypothetical protein